MVKRGVASVDRVRDARVNVKGPLLQYTAIYCEETQRLCHDMMRVVGKRHTMKNFRT